MSVRNHGVADDPAGTSEPPAGGETVPPRRLSRRRLLLSAAGVAGVAALGGIAFGVDEWVGAAPWPSGAVRSFRSRPDLQPPTVAVNVTADGADAGYVFLAPSAGAGQYGPMIMDDRGEPVWFRPVSGPWPEDGSELGNLVAANFKTQTFRGRPVLTWWEGIIVAGHGIGHCVIVDDRYRRIATVDAGNGRSSDLHEFVVTPDGTALITYYESVPADLTEAGGPEQGHLLDSGFQEVDIATGAVRYEWRARDHVGLTESYNPVGTSGTADAPWDFFHINSVERDADGTYLVSSRHTWAVYKVDGSTGAVRWRLNGKQSDFRVGHGAQFAWQHDARTQPGGRLSLFDDGAGQFTTENRARGMILALDETTMTARLVEEYVHPGPIEVASQGSTQILANGNIFVGWGSQPYVSEFSADGRLLFDAQMPPNGVSYRAYRFPWAGRPDERPALANEAADGGTVVVGTRGQAANQQAYASWNGSTDVEVWQVEAGPGRSSLRTVARGPKVGFETTLPWRSGATDRFVAVAALDGRGGILARSHAIPV